ncbi:hypothetical protein BU16DRAFT_228777 [Lophium mytilinum]|uniref:Uncharacterized protein n=1 Tax=Lophium mytilinum TaxID=390894 RepID=A0A6A6Q974_9PEZI|nr:hypothetical protein BU16DRAFT_228777 [Lophium mytilinum]
MPETAPKVLSRLLQDDAESQSPKLQTVYDRQGFSKQILEFVEALRKVVNGDKRRVKRQEASPEPHGERPDMSRGVLDDIAVRQPSSLGYQPCTAVESTQLAKMPGNSACCPSPRIDHNSHDTRVFGDDMIHSDYFGISTNDSGQALPHPTDLSVPQACSPWLDTQSTVNTASGDIDLGFYTQAFSALSASGSNPDFPPLAVSKFQASFPDDQNRYAGSNAT